jgi:dolichyl-phosphate beta-glucosyltransferase
LQMVAVLGLRTTSDPQCGVKVIQREPVAKLMAATTSTGYAFDIELITRARRSGLRVVERPVRWHHAEGSCIRPVRDGAATMKELIKMRRRLRAEGS